MNNFAHHFADHFAAAAQADGIELWDNRWELKSDRNHYVTALDKFLPRASLEERNKKFHRWKSAVSRSLNWAGASDEKRNSTLLPDNIAASVPCAVFVFTTFLLCKLADYFVDLN